MVKLYSDEHGHQSVRALSGIVASCLARVEVPAAIWRKQRRGEIKAIDAAVLVGDFEADYFGENLEPARFIILALPAEILDESAGLAARHGLRAYDAVQLASAKAARAADAGCHAMACFDEELRTAASLEGFSLIPHEN